MYTTRDFYNGRYRQHHPHRHRDRKAPARTQGPRIARFLHLLLQHLRQEATVQAEVRKCSIFVVYTSILHVFLQLSLPSPQARDQVPGLRGRLPDQGGPQAPHLRRREKVEAGPRGHRRRPHRAQGEARGWRAPGASGRGGQDQEEGEEEERGKHCQVGVGGEEDWVDCSQRRVAGEELTRSFCP